MESKGLYFNYIIEFPPPLKCDVPSKGDIVQELNEATKIIFISVGKDDLINDPDILMEASAQEVDPQARDEHNLKIVLTVTERVNKILQRITQDFPNLRVVYISPPPSSREATLFMQLRDSLKKLDIFKKVTYLDIAELLTGDDWEITEEGSDPGCLTWCASRVMMNLVYTTVFPNNDVTFCITCSGIHTEYCPGKDVWSDGPIKSTLERDQCWFCLLKGHRAAACPTKESLKKNRVWCPHCSTSPDQLVHHPDFCQGRFVVCDVCNQSGHKTAVHKDPAALKKVFDRIGFNLINKDVVEVSSHSEESTSKKRKLGKSQEVALVHKQ